MALKSLISIVLAGAALTVGAQAAWAISDASDRAQQAAIIYADAHNRAMSPGGTTSSGPLTGHVDRYELDLPSGSTGVEATGTGTDIAWPQLGIGFGVGILFVLGLIVAFRLTRGRPFAHG